MTAIQYLNQVDGWNKTINNKLSEIWQLRQLVANIGVVTKEINVQSSSDHDKLGASVSKILDKENELSEYINDFIQKKDCIISQIYGMSDYLYIQVLFSRYIEMMTFQDIADHNDYSVRQIYRIHDRAIKEFDKKYSESYR